MLFKVAANYGKPDDVFDAELLELWRKALRDNLAKVEDRPMVMKEKPPTGASQIL